MADAQRKHIECAICAQLKPLKAYYQRNEPISCICIKCVYVGRQLLASKKSLADPVANKMLMEYVAKITLDHRNKSRQTRRRTSYEAVKAQIFRRLGNKCHRCGEPDLLVLQIDHIKGGGTKERQGISSLARYQKVLENIKKYQILCANCNIRKRWENKEH